MATRGLSPKQIQERTQMHRMAVHLFARLAAMRAVQNEMKARGVRVTLVKPADIAAQAKVYLDQHPELYQQALERANRFYPQQPQACSISTISVQMLGAQ